MKKIYNLQQRVNRKLGQYQLAGEKMLAQLGDAEGNLLVDDDNLYLMYARLDDGTLLKVWNFKTEGHWNESVWVGPDEHDPYHLYVQNTQSVFAAPTNHGMPAHHHEFGYTNTTWVWAQQFMPWLVRPKGRFSVTVYKNNLYIDDAYVLGDTEDIDLTSRIPGDGARFVLIQLDEDGTTLSVKNGDVELGTDLPVVPTPDDGCIPIAAVRLYDGQIKIQYAVDNTDVLDLRSFGIQSANAITNLGAGVRKVLLTGLDTSTSRPIVATDNILQAFGFLQSQIDNDVQPLDSDLTDIAALTPADNDILQRKSGHWSNRSLAEYAADLNLSGTNSGDVTIGTANGLSLADQALSMGLASSDANGALSSTDWSTFNGKQDALSFPLSPTLGGTGANNGSNALTVPATGTAALLSYANAGSIGVGKIPDGDASFHALYSSDNEPRGYVSEDIISSASSGGFTTRHARGTIGAPTAVLANDSLGHFVASGHDGVGYMHHEGLIQFFAAENFVHNTNYGTHMTVQLVANATGYTIYEHTRFDQNGNLNVNVGNVIVTAGKIGVGVASPASPIDVYGTGNGAETLRFTIDRAWVFRQLGTAGSTALELFSSTNGKNFFVNPNDNSAGGLIVGNSTPSAPERLTVIGSGNIKALVETLSSTGYAFNRLKNDAGNLFDFGMNGSARVGSIFGINYATAGVGLAYVNAVNGPLAIGTSASSTLTFATSGVARASIASGGGLTVTGGTDTIQSRILANATQTANIATWETSGGSVLASVSGVGAFLAQRAAIGPTAGVNTAKTIEVRESFTDVSGTSYYGVFTKPTVTQSGASTSTVRALEAESIFNLGGFNNTNSRGPGAIGAITTISGIGTVTQASAIVASIIGQSNAVITAADTFLMESPTLSGGATITTAYGQRIKAQKVSGVTTGYAIYSEGATDLSYLAGALTVDGNIKLGVVGSGFYVKEGTNATMGVATLVAGVATVSTTKVTANSRIALTIQSLGTVAVPKSIGVTAKTAGTSFVITSADLTDTSVVFWQIFEPA